MAAQIRRQPEHPWHGSFHGNEPYTIVGVLGKSYFSDPASDIWIPFQFDRNTLNQGHYFKAAGRLKPGLTLALANALLKVTSEQFRRRYPVIGLGPNESFQAEPLRDAIVGDARSSHGPRRKAKIVSQVDEMPTIRPSGESAFAVLIASLLDYEGCRMALADENTHRGQALLL